MTKPALPQGTRDFSPEVVRKRNHILNTIRDVFELYGYQPLETPAMENLETLMGKYGDEGDKLIFKILNNGIGDPKNVDKSKLAFDQVLGGKNDKNLTERALKYDLTIPFARWVAMNHAQLSLPFKRYQIQPVWRADRPQKGRYREFTQCDADVVGSRSLWNEVELAYIYHESFVRLGIRNYELRINNRKILAALAELCGGIEKMIDISIAIDKLDKIGIEKVKEELVTKGISAKQTAIIEEYLLIKGDNQQQLKHAEALLGKSETGKKGIEELTTILTEAALPGQSPNLIVDFTLARGLNYYTGTIFEVKAKDVQIGSIGGGGRYDDLTGLFGVPNIPGVGISFGVDRIYDVMEELNLFPETLQVSTKVLFFNLGEAEAKVAFSLMQQLRARGISAELYHESAKFDKQFKYAEKKNIPYSIIIGSKELETRTCMVKDLRKGEQVAVSFEELRNYQFN